MPEILVGATGPSVPPKPDKPYEIQVQVVVLWAPPSDVPDRVTVTIDVLEEQGQEDPIQPLRHLNTKVVSILVTPTHAEYGLFRFNSGYAHKRVKVEVGARPEADLQNELLIQATVFRIVSEGSGVALVDGRVVELVTVGFAGVSANTSLDVALAPPESGECKLKWIAGSLIGGFVDLTNMNSTYCITRLTIESLSNMKFLGPIANQSADGSPLNQAVPDPNLEPYDSEDEAKKYGKFTWEFPAGSFRPGETFNFMVRAAANKTIMEVAAAGLEALVEFEHPDGLPVPPCVIDMKTECGSLTGSDQWVMFECFSSGTIDASRKAANGQIYPC